MSRTIAPTPVFRMHLPSPVTFRTVWLGCHSGDDEDMIAVAFFRRRPLRDPDTGLFPYDKDNDLGAILLEAWEEWFAPIQALVDLKLIRKDRDREDRWRADRWRAAVRVSLEAAWDDQHGLRGLYEFAEAW